MCSTNKTRKLFNRLRYLLISLYHNGVFLNLELTHNIFICSIDVIIKRLHQYNVVIHTRNTVDLELVVLWSLGKSHDTLQILSNCYLPTPSSHRARTTTTIYLKAIYKREVTCIQTIKTSIKIKDMFADKDFICL